MADEAASPPAEVPLTNVAPVQADVAPKPVTAHDKPDAAISVRDSVVAARKEVAAKAAAPSAAQPRSEHGHFAEKAVEGAPAALPADPSSPQPVTPTPSQVIEPPAAAKAILKATDWAKLPPSIRDALAKDLAALDSYVPEQAKGAVDFTQAVYERFRPHEAQMRAAGLSNPYQAIDALARLQERYMAGPEAYVEWLASQHGLTVTRAPNSQATPTQPQDPRYGMLESEVQQLKRERAAERSASHAAQAADLDRQIAAFRDAKDGQGSPKHAHFDVVREHMAALMQSGKAMDLADAYDQALWANAQTRTAAFDAKYKATEAARAAEAKKAAETARASASPPKGAPGGQAQSKANSGGTLRDQIRNALRERQADA